MDLIYLDNAATTRVSAAVRAEVERAERELYFNSAALYAASLSVKKEIERAARVIKEKIARSADGELVFTSGATEGNNMVIFGKITNIKQHILVAAGEHSSVYAPSVALKNQGFDVDYVPLNSVGEIDRDALKRLVRPNTALFVFGMVNSDTGVLQNSGGIVKAVRAVNPRVHIHCDAVQAFCKFDFDAVALGLDSVVVSGHKINGPKGVGALWMRKGTKLKPVMYGGAQQDYRPGTENNPGILGFAKAAETFDTAGNYARIIKLKQRLAEGVAALGCGINGGTCPNFSGPINPYITNVQLRGILGNTVMNALSARGICVGLGSACAANASKNRTLLAMGVPEEKTKQVLRISFGAFNTEADIETFLGELQDILKKLA
jgi:cysteine desulfurase